MPSGQTDRRDALAPGTVLRDYTVEAALGHGGFGIVYRARHNELGHLVAIKEYLPAELAVREGNTVAPRSTDCEEHFANGLRRFRDEAKALIDLHGHPNIVECRDFFRGNSTAYLVMDFVDGQPLSEVLRRREAAGRPFEEADLLAVAVPLAEGLGHVHRAGILHRDIKPANILIRRADERPVLIDFGAAKQSVAEHTRSRAPYTEGYAALEQVSDGEVGPWTDLYGLGAVLWRIVAGGSGSYEQPAPVKVESRANASVRGTADPLTAASTLGSGRFPTPVLEAIDACLKLNHAERPRDSEGLLRILKRDKRESSRVTASPSRDSASDAFQAQLASQDRRSGQTLWRVRSWRKHRVLGMAGLSIASVCLAMVLSNRQSQADLAAAFTVETEPETATVSLLNHSEPYRHGMLLALGRYEVEVSASGFETRREWVDHTDSVAAHRITLDRIDNQTTGLYSDDSASGNTASEATQSEGASAEAFLENYLEASGRFALFTGCRSMYLGVNDLSQDARSIGLSVERIRHSAESRLRSAKLFRSPNSPWSKDIYNLSISINVVGMAFNISVAFKKPVFDSRSGLSKSAITWDRASAGTHGRDASFIISALSEHIDAFIVEYLRVNEQECF